MAAPLVQAVSSRDRAVLASALAKHRGPIPARVVVQAGGAGWRGGLSLLLRAGADLNGSYKNYRALHALIQEDPHAGGSSTPERVKCLEWLLAKGADPELSGAWPATRALVIAAFVGEPKYVTALLEGGAREDAFTLAALGRARRLGTLLAEDSGLARARDDGRLTALQCCCGSRLGARDRRVAQGLHDCARRLVEAGADVNARTRSWAEEVDVGYFVIRSGQVETLKLLLEHGLDPSSAVVTAAWDGREDLVDLLLAHGANLDRPPHHARPVLNELVRWGQFERARRVLARGASPNVPDDRGWTAVHQAVSRGNAKILADLLAAGGNPDLPDRSGRTPRDLARSRTLLAALRSAISGIRS